jgi:formylglycine-generating enzyme required for sulfatase activity
MDLAMWEPEEAGLESVGPALEGPLLAGRNVPRLAARSPDAGAREASAVVKRYLVGAAAKDEAAVLETGTSEWRVSERTSPDRLTGGFSRGELRLVAYEIQDPQIAGSSANVTVVAQIERSGHASQETMRFSLGRRAGDWQVEDTYVGEAARMPAAFENAIGMRFVLVPAGTFTMGSPASEESRSANETWHEVTISRPFHVSTHETTNRQYLRFKSDHRSGRNFDGD